MKRPLIPPNGSKTNGLLTKRDISNGNYRFTDQVKSKFSDIRLLNRCSAVGDNPARNTFVIFSMLDQVFSDIRINSDGVTM